jgi:hypothetical protein
MFCRDEAIARNEKRRQDGIYIKVLTHKLFKTLSTPLENSTDRKCPSSDCMTPQDTTDGRTSHKTKAYVDYSQLAAPPIQEGTGPDYNPEVNYNLGTHRQVHAAPALTRTNHGLTWEQQNQRDLTRMARELSRPYDYQPTQQSTQKSSSRKKGPVINNDAKIPSTVDIKMISGNGFLFNMR